MLPHHDKFYLWHLPPVHLLLHESFSVVLKVLLMVMCVECVVEAYNF